MSWFPIWILLLTTLLFLPYTLPCARKFLDPHFSETAKRFLLFLVLLHPSLSLPRPPRFDPERSLTVQIRICGLTHFPPELFWLIRIPSPLGSPLSFVVDCLCAPIFFRRPVRKAQHTWRILTGWLFRPPQAPRAFFPPPFRAPGPINSGRSPPLICLLSWCGSPPLLPVSLMLLFLTPPPPFDVFPESSEDSLPVSVVGVSLGNSFSFLFFKPFVLCFRVSPRPPQHAPTPTSPPDPLDFPFHPNGDRLLFLFGFHQNDFLRFPGPQVHVLPPPNSRSAKPIIFL